MRGNLKVLVKGSLVLCDKNIYSYQMKIGEKVYGDDNVPCILLVDKEGSPSATTTRHINWIMNRAISAGLAVVTVPHFP